MFWIWFEEDEKKWNQEKAHSCFIFYFVMWSCISESSIIDMVIEKMINDVLELLNNSI